MGRCPQGHMSRNMSNERQCAALTQMNRRLKQVPPTLPHAVWLPACIIISYHIISPPVAKADSRHQLPLTCQVRWPNHQANLQLVRISIGWKVLMPCATSMLLGGTRRHSLFKPWCPVSTNSVCTGGTTTRTIAPGIMNALWQPPAGSEQARHGIETDTFVAMERSLR